MREQVAHLEPKRSDDRFQLAVGTAALQKDLAVVAAIDVQAGIVIIVRRAGRADPRAALLHIPQATDDAIEGVNLVDLGLEWVGGHGLWGRDLGAFEVRAGFGTWRRRNSCEPSRLGYYQATSRK